MKDHHKGYLYSLLSAILASIAFIIIKILLQEIHFASLLLYEFMIGTILLFFVILFKYKGFPIKKLLRKEILFAGLFIGGASICWIYSIDVLGPTTTSFIAKLNIPFSILLGIIVFKESFNYKEILGIIIALIGVIIISYSKNIVIMISALVTVLQAILYSFHSLTVKKIIDRLDIWLIIFGRCFIAVIIIFLFGMFTTGLKFPNNFGFKIWFLLFLEPVTGILANNFFRYSSLKLIGLSKNSILASLDPIFVSVMSVLFLAQSLPLLKYIGGAIIIIGVIVVIMHKPNKTGKEKLFIP